MIFASFCACSAIYGAYLLRKTLRNPDKWHIEAYSKKLLFHNYPLAGIAGVIIVVSTSVVVLEFLL